MKEAIVSLANTGDTVVRLGGVKADCACIATHIATNEIPPMETVPLKLSVLQYFEGDFNHTVVVTPKDGQTALLRIPVSGKAEQAFLIAVKWSHGEYLTLVNKPLSLGQVFQEGATLVVSIRPKDSLQRLAFAVVEVESASFEVAAYRYERASDPSDDQKQNEHCIVELVPKRRLTRGFLREDVLISFRDSSKILIPLACDVVGDCHADKRMVNMGNLRKHPREEVLIRFRAGRTPWKSVKWTSTGFLSKAIAVEQMMCPDEAGCIRLILTALQNELDHLPRGYLVDRLSFYANSPSDDDAIQLLVDGFNGHVPHATTDNSGDSE